MPKVLVTGGSGFIAGHCINQLLQRGYEVVTTVRNAEKGKRVQKAHSASPQRKLDFVIVEDIAQDGAFDEVIKSTPGYDYVLHTASPFHYNVQDPVKDFLEPAIRGTTGILKAIKKNAASVKRVVVTSSYAAVRDGSKSNPPFYDESVWNPITWDEAVADTKATYRGSKTLAEKAAWEFIEKEKPNFDLVTINPTLIFGPVAPHLEKGELGSINTSNFRILHMIEGKMKEQLQPTGFYTYIDVRDVALAHVNALEAAAAGGKRFLMITDYFTNKEIAKIIVAAHPEFKDRLPADIDGQDDDVPALAERYTWSSRQVREILGIEYTSLEDSVKDTVESLLKLGE